MNKLKVFELRWAVTDEKEWVAAYTNIHALQVYTFITGVELYSLDNTDEIEELPESEWDKNFIINSEYDPNDPDDNWQKMSFAEWMKGRTRPDIIAGSMYD